MNYLSVFFQSLKNSGFFSKKEESYVSEYSKRIPIISELDLKKERNLKESEKYIVNDSNNFLISANFRELSTITLPMLERFFSDIANVKDPMVKDLMSSIRKGFSIEDKGGPNAVFSEMESLIPNGNITEYSKVLKFLVDSDLAINRTLKSFNYEKDYYSFNLSRYDFHFIRCNEIKERGYQKINAPSKEVFSYSKVEDVLKGHYKIKKIPSFYKSMVDGEKTPWIVLERDEQKKMRKHLLEMKEQGLIENYGNCVRFNPQCLLNKWLSSPEARIYQEIKDDALSEERNKRNEIKNLKLSEDASERKMGHRLDHIEVKNRFKLN